jgi:hypothetical protein
MFDGLSTPAISYFHLHPKWSLLGQAKGHVASKMPYGTLWVKMKKKL